jgi:hypothetical protein
MTRPPDSTPETRAIRLADVPPDHGSSEQSWLADPGRGVPSATSGRFGVLVLVLAASTGAIFGYLWQLSQTGLEARVQACLSQHATLPVAEFAQRISDTATGPVQTADCVRPAGPSLMTWSLAGVAMLAVVTLMLYWTTPWWIRRGGLRGRRRLQDLGVTARDRHNDRLKELSALAGLKPLPAFLADWGNPRLTAKAFGRPGNPQVRLSAGLLTRQPDDPRFTATVLHELAHLRSRDLRVTYLTIAARNAFCIVVPVGYVAVLAVAGTGPFLPDPRTSVAVAVLAVLVFLNIRSVNRGRELEANATAVFLHRHLRGGARSADQDEPGQGGLHGWNEPLPWTAPHGKEGQPADAPGSRLRRCLQRWTRAWGWSPTLTAQRAALLDPRLLYRPDVLAMFSAGIAAAVIGGEVTPAAFSVVLGTWLGSPFSLLFLTPHRAILLMLFTYGPAALITSAVVAALACTSAWRIEYQAQKGRSGAGFRQLGRLALPLAAGLIAGIPLNVDYAMAGTWGIFDTSAGRDLILLAMSAVVLSTILLIVFRWSRESATAWFTTDPRRSRVLRVAITVTGTVAFFPPIYAWTLTNGLPLTLQARLGPTGQQSFLGHWPGAAAIDAHLLPVGAWDILPGSAFLMALGCVFVAAGGPRRVLPQRQGMPVRLVLAAGLIAGAIAVIASVGLFLPLRAAIGDKAVIQAGGGGLLYFTRVFQLLVLAAGGLAAAWVARRAQRTAMTSGILVALVASALAVVFVPRLLVVAVYGWHRVSLNPRTVPTLYGDAGNLLGGKVVIAAVLLAAAAAALPRRTASGPTRRMNPAHPAGSASIAAQAVVTPVRRFSRAIPAVATRLAVALLLGGTLLGLALYGYLYVTQGFAVNF